MFFPNPTVDHLTRERDAWAAQMEADFRSHQGMIGPRPVAGTEQGFHNRFPGHASPVDLG